MSYINNTAGYEAFTSAAVAIVFLRECAECANPIPLKDWASLYFSIENSIKNKYIF